MNHLNSVKVLSATGSPPQFNHVRRTLRLARPKGPIPKDLIAHPVVAEKSRGVRNFPR
jgi:hypothetical protein